MGKLQELLDELCPNGVEYKTIGEIAEDIFRGAGIKRDDVTENGVPCVRYGEIYTTYGIWFDECVSHTELEKVPSPKFFEHGDILFAITGESVDEIAKSCAYVGYDKCLAGGDIVILKHKQNPKYLAYALATTNAQAQKSAGKVKSKVVHSSVPSIKSILIPIPPLPVQAEIVRILDAFTELTTELVDKLNMEIIERKKQYAYYRDLLLSFDYSSTPPPIPWKCTKNQAFLGSFAKFTYGYTDKAQADGDARFIRITDIDENGCLNVQDAKYIHLSEESRAYLLKRGDLLVARTGATYGKTLYIPNDAPAVYASFLIKITLDENVMTNRFYWHFAQSSLYWEQANRLVSTGGQPQFNAGAIRRILVPVPPLDEQRRIVAVLDHFDALCNDLTAGLPAEIEARRRQYEYYRDKLLSFKEWDT